MKAYLIAVATVALLSSCFSLPPASRMGDGSIQQIGLINWSQVDQGVVKPKPNPPVTVKVSDNTVEIKVPKK
jgi:hypothetical protein